MKKSTWNNGLRPRSLKSNAVLISADGRIQKFVGRSIPGWCQVVDTVSESNGKWSNDTFTVALHESTFLVGWVQDWESGRTFPQGTWEDGLAWINQAISDKAWEEKREVYPQTKAETFRQYIQENWPRTFARWEEVEEGLSFLSEPPPR